VDAMGPRAFLGFLRGLMYGLREIDVGMETPGVEAVQG
jgi:hypothetical protein